MAGTVVNPTRMELSRLKRKLATAQKGHRLLKDKLDELMRRFLEIVKETMALRTETEQALYRVNQKFVLAKAMSDSATLYSALLLPTQSVYLSIRIQNVMSVMIPRFQFETRSPNADDIYPYGYAFTPFELDEAIGSLREVFPSMLTLAEKEKACYLMADEIEKTRRRVNALEHVMIPDYCKSIRFITMKLDENERGSQVRLMKVKERRSREMLQQKAAEGNAVTG